MNGITIDFAETPMSFRGLLLSYFASHKRFLQAGSS